MGAHATAEGFTYTRNVDGRVQWEMKAKKVEFSEDRQIAEFRIVEAVFYDEKDRSVKISGEKGLFHSDSQDVELEGDVRVETSLGYTMFADKIVYSDADRVIRSRSPVFVKGEGVSMNSENMKITVNDEKLELFGNVKGTIWNPKMLEQAKGQ